MEHYTDQVVPLLNEKMGDVEKASPSDSSTTDTEDTVANIPLETPSSAVPSNPPPPPSKWTAWAQILAGHLMVFNTFGYIGSWGLFQAYYIEALNSSSSNIAWVGSLQLFLVFAIGTLSGRALDAGFLRFTIASGCALQIIAIFTTSVVGSYWQLFLAQGVCQGIGNGLTFTPMISLVSTYYSDKYRALAVSFVAAGAATGGMVFPSIARQLLQSVGVGWTLRVMGFVFITNSVVTLALIKPRVAARKSGPLFEFVAFKEVPFLLYTVGTFLALWGLYFAYYYVSLFEMLITSKLIIAGLDFFNHHHPRPFATIFLLYHGYQCHRDSRSHPTGLARSTLRWCAQRLHPVCLHGRRPPLPLVSCLYRSRSNRLDCFLRVLRQRRTKPIRGRGWQPHQRSSQDGSSHWHGILRH